MRTETTYKPKKIAERFYSILIYCVLGCTGLAMAIPFFWMFSVSFDKAAASGIPFPPRLLPYEFTWTHYIQAFARLKLARLYLNTASVTVGVVLISVISAMLAAYSLSKIRFKGANSVLIVFLATMMIPQEAILIPLFLFFKQLGWINSYTAFYVTALAYPFGIFLAKQFMDTLPDSLREAAIVDGANEFWVFLKVYLPLSGTIAATLAILQFLASWNNLLWPLILLNSPAKYTMQLGLAMFRTSIPEGTIMVYPGLIMAGNVFGLIPVLIVFLFLQKYIVESIAMSGIKQ